MAKDSTRATSKSDLKKMLPKEIYDAFPKTKEEEERIRRANENFQPRRDRLAKEKAEREEEEKRREEAGEEEGNGGYFDLKAETIQVPKVYAPLFAIFSHKEEIEQGIEYTGVRKFMLASGRISGKTSILVELWWATTNVYPDYDMVFLQATQKEIKDSIINEIHQFLSNSGYDVGDTPSHEFYIPKSHDRIERKSSKGITFFFPITDSNGGQRSRGIKTPHPVSLVLYEEAQKNKDANVVEQSIATFIRQLKPFSQLVVVGNNEEAGHWFVDFAIAKSKMGGWKYIYSNCYDIWNLLSKETQDYILEMKRVNEPEYRRMFLGDIKANNSDVVFPQFDQMKHYIERDKLPKKYFNTVFIGIDHATANDTFAVVPVAVMHDGTCQTLEVCYDDPKEKNRALSMPEQCQILERFMNFLDEQYGFVYNNIKVIISVDCAAPAFIKQVEHSKKTSRNRELWRLVKIKSFTAKRKKYEVNLNIIKNAFAYGALTIMNEGKYIWDNSINQHRLRKEIEAQRYKNGKLDDKIPNDLCDALEYALVPYYINCYNLSFPTRARESKTFQSILKSSNVSENDIKQLMEKY